MFNECNGKQIKFNSQGSSYYCEIGTQIENNIEDYDNKGIQVIDKINNFTQTDLKEIIGKNNNKYDSNKLGEFIKKVLFFYIRHIYLFKNHLIQKMMKTSNVFLYNISFWGRW